MKVACIEHAKETISDKIGVKVIDFQYVYAKSSDSQSV